MPKKVTNLAFSEALHAMEAGSKIKLPEWGGFWTWEEKDDTIVIFTKEGEVLDFRDSTMMKKTLEFISGRHDWKIMETHLEVTPECWSAYKDYVETDKVV